jgi:hypothetical protein
VGKSSGKITDHHATVTRFVSTPIVVGHELSAHIMQKQDPQHDMRV